MIRQGANPKLFLLLALGAFHIFFALFLNPPGYFSGDETVYYLMTRDFAQTGGLEIFNGYDELPSRELALENVRMRDGKLVPQYPYLFPLLAYPLFKLAGFKGLFLLNAAAFIGTVLLCYLLARRLLRDRELALNACLILVLATYSWEYAHGAWPHSLATFLVVAAFYLGILALQEENVRRSLLLSGAAGLVAGFGAGVRLDVIFVLPAVIAPLLFCKPGKWRQALAAGLGILPGMVVLAVTNHMKFGTYSPLSYGRTTGATSGIGPYLPIAGLALLFAVAFWGGLRLRERSGLRKRKGVVFLAIPILMLAVWPDFWHILGRWGKGIYQLVVDLRIRDLGILEGGLSRTQNGGVVYLGTLKKSLLQSCPYLVVLLIPLLAAWRHPQERRILGPLFLVPSTFIGIYSFFAWHGGQGFNMRYFLPALPFTAILTAVAWNTLSQCQRNPHGYLYLLFGVPTVAVYFLSVFIGKKVRAQRRPSISASLLSSP